MPCTSAGAQRSISSSVKAPLPQPTSIQRKPAGGASQSRKIVAGEPAPDAHHALVGGAVVEADLLFSHLHHTSIQAPLASTDLKTASSAAAVCRMPSGEIGNVPCPSAALAK